ncbi:hypothetical protein LCGC14_2330950 [marine sediment metagenome]|uniref:Uncharacterized protein n=1 Tax=marine sediment metagenome TaxID=412755 RepID=A0A0F9ESK4_9ZZZZ
MGIVTERKKAGAVCPRCGHPDYTLEPPDLDWTPPSAAKPMFKCASCNYTWCDGYDGREYMRLLRRAK